MKKVNVWVSGHVVVFHAAKPTEKFQKEDTTKYSVIWNFVDDGLVEEKTPFFAFIKELNYVVYNEGEGPIAMNKQKGKYLKTNTLWEERISKPFIFHLFDENDFEYEYCYTVELEDDEEFDPKKVQLVKSDYEVSFLPYGIVTDYIVYDGKKIECTHEPDYDGFTDETMYYYQDFDEIYNGDRRVMVQW